MKLNQNQEKAVQISDGSLLIQAGAGVGKTRVLAQKFFHLVRNCNVDPQSILSFSFTSKAAGELHSRIRDVVPTSDFPSVCTFHSFALFIVRQHGHLLPELGSFRISSQKKVQHMFESLSQGLTFGSSHFSVYQLMLYVAMFKHNLVSVKQAKASVKTDLEGEIVALYERYEALQKELSVIDFEDMLIYAIQILKQNPDVLRQYQDRYQYFFVDEYQDTNFAQNTLFIMLAENAIHRVVVGDFDQMIYAWRGANQHCMDQYESHFAPVKLITLEQNYRSTFYILNAANKLIAHNNKRVDRTLWTDQKEGYPVQFVATVDEYDELSALVSQIQSLKQSEAYRNSDIAVLVRTHTHFEKARKVLMANQLLSSKLEITYGDVPEVILLKAVLELYLDPKETTIVADLIDFFDHKKLTGQRRQPLNLNQLDTYPNTQSFMSAYKIFITTDYQDHHAFITALEPFLMTYFTDQYRSFMSAVFKDLNESSPSVQSALLTLESRLNDPVDVSDDVQLMTIHHSKGLEFPVVFILGLEEGNIPHTYSLNVNIEEERRLLYVGMTRAKEKLFLFYARQRHQFGMSQYTPLSSFIQKLPAGTFQTSFTEKAICSSDEGLVQLRNDYPAHQEFMPLMPIISAEETCFIFKEGDTVIHKVLGEGRLEKIIGADDDMIYQIAFDGDLKSIKASYAPLFPKE